VVIGTQSSGPYRLRLLGVTSRLSLICVRSLALLPTLVVLTSCGTSRSLLSEESSTANGSMSRPEQSVRQLDKKPSLSIVEREGDPAAALAFGGRIRMSSTVIVALAEVVRRRLGATAELKYEIFPNAFGLTISALIDSPDQVQRALGSLDSALSRHLAKNELDDKLIVQLRRLLLPSPSFDTGEQALADCTGEIILDEAHSELADIGRLRNAVGRALVELRSENNARFAIVGSSAFVAQAERALAEMGAWPKAALNPSSAMVPQPMPSPSITSSVGSLRKLSVAWRVASGDAAGSAATFLRARGSPLLAQVAALDDDWKVESISGVARDEGGCLRIDLTYPNDSPSLSIAGLRNIVQVAMGESERALEWTPLRESSYEVLLESDPRRAARRLAWSALSRNAEQPSSNSLQIHLRTLPSDPGGATLEPLLRAAILGKSGAPLESLSRLELGQTELWSVLASPCGTAWESAVDAGSTAAWVQATVRRYNGHLGVQIEPFITVDAIGFIAHSAPKYDRESPADLVRRVGNALGSVVGTGLVSGSELAAFREEALLKIGATPRQAWWQLADSLSLGHPAAFEPLGTFSSVRNLDLAAVRTRRSNWLSGPLRIAALLNGNARQSTELSATLHRWLDPHRQKISECPVLSTSNETSQDVQITTKSSDARDSNAYAAVQLASAFEQSTVFEHWLLWLLARPGGWLDTTLVQSGNLSSFSADIRGPRKNRVLIIGLNVEDENKLSEALVRIRELLGRLAKQGANRGELELAQSWSHDQIRRAELDPRRRLLDLWLGNSVPQNPKKSEFGKYMNRVLASAPVTVLRVRGQP